MCLTPILRITAVVALFIAAGAPGARAQESDIEDSEPFLEYSELYVDLEKALVQLRASPRHAIASARFQSLAPSELRALSYRLEAEVDGILLDAKHKKIALSEAFTKLANPLLLEPLGFLSFNLTPFQILVRIPARESYLLWSGLFRGGFRPPQGTESRFPQTGVVYFSRPILQNGHTFDAPENIEVAWAALLGYAEELYHAVQYARGNGYRSGGAHLISHYLEGVRGDRYERLSQLYHEDATDLVEADVYAKLLEVVGPERVHPLYADHYVERNLIGRGQFTGFDRCGGLQGGKWPTLETVPR